jgi:ketosteroid isomerase-like protein
MTTMNLPEVLTDLMVAQNSSDSAAYANCFSETAIVFDEGKKHSGKAAIKTGLQEQIKCIKQR